MKINVFEPTDSHRQTGCCKQASAKPAFFEVDPANGYSLEVDANDEGTVIDVDLYNANGDFVQTLFTYSIAGGITRQPLVPQARVVKNTKPYYDTVAKVTVCD